MDKRSEMVYQVRAGVGGTFEDLVAELTEAAWASLGSNGLWDSDRWSRLQRDFLEVFKNRLSFHPGCGVQPECLSADGADGPATQGGTYLLTLRGGLLRFVEGLGSLAWRRLGASRRRDLRLRLQESLHRALLPYLLYNEICSGCHVRAETSGRRMTPSRLPAV